MTSASPTRRKSAVSRPAGEVAVKDLLTDGGEPAPAQGATA